MSSVLIVDDAVFMRRMLADLFEEAGLEVVGEAGDGQEAVALFEELNPDFVTMDVVMPNMNGVEAVRRILKADPDACIVMVSAIGQESMIVEAMDAGARDYIVKPFRKEDVLAAVERLLEDR